MRSEQDIRGLMRSGMEQDSSPRRAIVAVGRARRQVGQRDSLAFALVRIWAVLARLLAPLFAAFSQRQAQAIYQHSGEKGKFPLPIRIKDKGTAMIDEVQETVWQPMVGLWTKVAEFLPSIAGAILLLIVTGHGNVLHRQQY